MITLNILKDGKQHAVTMSYDDGMINDKQLISIFNRYGIRGTFHLNSGHYPHAGEHAIHAEELAEVYKGHEIACHGVRHSTMPFLDSTGILHEIFEDRKYLETYAGYPVRGLSYANGAYTQEMLPVLAACGIVYSRTTKNTNYFGFPEKFLEWHPTCHQRSCIEAGTRFMEALDGYYSGPKLLYVWGHSHEFEHAVKWDTIEQFCKIVAGDDRIWYATNIEIYDYVQAQRNLVISADHTMVYNPSAMEVWFSSDGVVQSVAPGAVWKKENC